MGQVFDTKGGIMWRRGTWMGILAGTIALGGCGKTDGPVDDTAAKAREQEFAALQGTWLLESAEYEGGKDVPLPGLLEIGPGRISTAQGTGVSGSLHMLSIDPSKTPKEYEYGQPSRPGGGEPQLH